MSRKLQYNPHNNKIMSYRGGTAVCECGCNAFHYEHVGEDIRVVCNDCQVMLTTIKSEYKAEVLATGVWRQI